MNKNLKKLIKQFYTSTPTSKNYKTIAMMITDYDNKNDEYCVRYRAIKQEQLPDDITDLNCRRSILGFLINKYKLDIIRKAGLESSDVSDEQIEKLSKLYSQVENFIVNCICEALGLSIIEKEENNEEIIK